MTSLDGQLVEDSQRKSERMDVHDRQCEYRDATHRDGESGEDVVQPEVILRERSDVRAQSRDNDTRENREA